MQVSILSKTQREVGQIRSKFFTVKGHQYPKMPYSQTNPENAYIHNKVRHNFSGVVA